MGYFHGRCSNYYWAYALPCIPGTTIYDRMNGLGVIGADTILLLVLFGYMDGRPDMYVDIAISYAILGFICSVVVAKYLGGKNV